MPKHYVRIVGFLSTIAALVVVLILGATALGGHWYDWAGTALAIWLASGTGTLMWTRFWPRPEDPPVSLMNFGDWVMFLSWGAIALLIWTGDCLDRWGREPLPSRSQPT